MRPAEFTRALAGVALTVLALAACPAQPVLAQTATPSPAPAVTPRPAASPSAAPGSRGQSPSSLPGASGTPAPGAPQSGASNPSGGARAIDASAIPTLPPADQAAPLPFPAYGTPAPVSQTRVAPGVPQVITLQQAVLIAYARSPLLASARADVEIASAPVGLAQSALFPAVTGNASTTRAHREGGTTTTTTGTTGGATFNPNSTTNSLNVSLQQLIFDGGRVAAQIRGARATQSASIATYQRQLQTVAFNVATAFYNTLAAQRQTQVALTTVQLDQVQESLVTAQIRAGTAARTDLATAQLPTAQARVAVIRSQANEQVQLATFANTLGLDADVAVQPKDDVPAVSATAGTLAVAPSFPTPSYQTAVTRALALRPDLTAQQQNIAANRENVRAAKLGNFPNVNANAAYGTTSSDPGGGSFRNSSSVGLALTIPFYDRGVTKAQTAQAQGQLDRALAQLQVAEQGVQLNVRTALVNLVAAYAALDQTNAELQKAQEVLRATQAQYRAGVTTLPLLLNAQVGLTQALTDEVTSVYTVRQAEQALLYAEGANAAG
ncbi:MAG: outer membrane protein [Candidatus Eremiobacteraeota bacterium]|jgi:outer membrane protein|nr:outer membrane protein [Candidatus Eremiobacteraeota bacterium]